MQPLSCLILYWDVHCEEWPGSLPYDRINMALDDVLKRVTEARVSEQIIQELQGVLECLLTDPGWSWRHMSCGRGINCEQRGDFSQWGRPWYGVDVA